MKTPKQFTTTFKAIRTARAKVEEMAIALRQARTLWNIEMGVSTGLCHFISFDHNLNNDVKAKLAAFARKDLASKDPHVNFEAHVAAQKAAEVMEKAKAEFDAATKALADAEADHKNEIKKLFPKAVRA